jgi:hypothetical protein
VNHYSDQIRAELARNRLFAKRLGVKRSQRRRVCPCVLWFKWSPLTRRKHRAYGGCPNGGGGGSRGIDHATLWTSRRVPGGARPGPVLFVSQPYREPSNEGNEGRLWQTCRDRGCTVQFWDTAFSPYSPGRTYLVMVWGPRVTPRPMGLMGEVRSSEDVWGVDNVLV